MNNLVEKQGYNSYDSVPLFLNASNIASLLSIPKSDVYFMFHAADFPTITIGGRMIVRKDRLFQWLEIHPRITLNPKIN